MHSGHKEEKKESVTRKRNVLIYYSISDAQSQEKKSNEKSAINIIKKNFDDRTDKIKKSDLNDSLYDGYFAVITDEMDYDTEKIQKVFRNLRNLDETFRLLNSDIDTNVLYLKNQEHVRANLSISFVSLVILRMIQSSMGEYSLSQERIVEALRNANCLQEKGGHVRLLPVSEKIQYTETADKPNPEILYEDQIASDYRHIQKTFGTDFYYAYAKKEDFKRFFKEMKLRKASEI